MKFDVLMLAFNDWANTGYRTMKCLESLGLKVLGFKGLPHPFCYPHQLTILPELMDGGSEVKIVGQVDSVILRELAAASKVMHFISSSGVDLGIDLRKKKVVMQHGGMAYRNNSKYLNPAYNQFVTKTVVQMPDLLGLGAKDEELIYFPVDTEYLQPDWKFKRNGKLRIGHFPTSYKTKGTEVILKVINSLPTSYSERFEFITKEEGIRLWFDQIEAMRQCDVVIDVFKPTWDGKQYGEWGNVSFEAAALGKIVITMSQRKEIYQKEYGNLELMIANTEEELTERLEEIIESSDSDLIDKANATRNWVVEKHSIQATAQRWWDKVYKEL